MQQQIHSRAGRTRTGLGAALLVLGLALPVGAADETLGYVSSLAGEATAQRAGEEPRALACGDPVYADDTLRTAADSRVGVMLEDVAAHLSASTQVALGRTEIETPSARLESGMVRVIDPRESGNAAQLAVLDAAAQVVGNDAEAYLFAEKVGPYAMLCEWDAPLPVSRGEEGPHTADPGECVIAKPTEPLYTAKAHDQRIPAAPDELCDFDVAAGSPLDHLNPRDVAGPGLPTGADFQALAYQGPGYMSCEIGGPACGLGLPVVAAPGGAVTGTDLPNDGGVLP